MIWVNEGKYIVWARLYYKRGTKTVVDVITTEKFWKGPVLLIKKLIFDVTCEEIGVVRSHFSSHWDTVRLFVKIASKWKLVKC